MSFYVSQLVGETSRDAPHPCQDGEEGINAVKKRHIGGNVSVVREVIDSSESRQNFQDGEGFSDLSGYRVESRTHPGATCLNHLLEDKFTSPELARSGPLNTEFDVFFRRQFKHRCIGYLYDP